MPRILEEFETNVQEALRKIHPLIMMVLLLQKKKFIRDITAIIDVVGMMEEFSIRSKKSTQT